MWCSDVLQTTVCVSVCMSFKKQKKKQDVFYRERMKPQGFNDKSELYTLQVGRKKER